MKKQNLEKLFSPKNIAVIGASNKEGSVGFSIIKNLYEENFRGEIFPINIRTQEIFGKICNNSITEIKYPIDLVIIATPAVTVPQILEDCGRLEIPAALILSAGFKEIGAKGKVLYSRIKQIGEQYDIRIIGPNCIGFINGMEGINASFLSRPVLPGNIAFISQSGAICASIIDWAYDQGVGFRYFVSMGSMIDVDFADLIDYFGNDDKTDCILIYMETLDDAQKFLSAARAFSMSKPIVVLKAGKSEAGAKAALSHTGSLAGNDAVFDAAFKKSGIIRVNKINQLFDCAQAFSMQPFPKGKQLTIVTNAGGPGILATDHLVQMNGRITPLTKNTLQKLNTILSKNWSHNNPVDVLGDADAGTFARAVDICLKAKESDAVLAMFVTQDVTSPTQAAQELISIIEKLPADKSENKKPILACWLGEQDVQVGRDLLEKAGIPQFRYPEDAIDAFLKMHDYHQNQLFLEQDQQTIAQQFNLNQAEAYNIISSVIQNGRHQLTEIEAKRLLATYNIPVASSQLVHSENQAVTNANTIGYPVVLKIVSPDIGHKTEVGGVKINLKNAKEVRTAYQEIIKDVTELAPKSKIEGVLLEKMIRKKHELLIGAKRDPIFGPVVVFGMGGTLVELWRDTNISLAPIHELQAMELMKPTKAYQLISGFRNLPQVNLKWLSQILIQFSQLISDFPQIKEVDINPFAVDEAGGFALDAHIVLLEQD